MPAHNSCTLNKDRKLWRDFNNCVTCFRSALLFRPSYLILEPLQTACLYQALGQTTCLMKEQSEHKHLLMHHQGIIICQGYLNTYSLSPGQHFSLKTALQPQESTSGCNGVQAGRQAGSSQLTFSRRCKVGSDLRLFRPSSAISWLK